MSGLSALKFVASKPQQGNSPNRGWVNFRLLRVAVRARAVGVSVLGHV
jgi:hypothetical protein